jgi:hypothetical protein
MSPLNVQPDPVVVNLHHLAIALGADYTDGLVIAAKTRKEMEDLGFDAQELAARVGHRVRAVPMTRHLMTITRKGN